MGSELRHRNVAAGAASPRMRVTGEGVALGRLGRLQGGLPARRVDLNLDWRSPTPQPYVSLCSRKLIHLYKNRCCQGGCEQLALFKSSKPNKRVSGIL